ncbi:class I SAM-dependent methyltransferase [Leeuwenhoekiella sp. CH_XMU1409-2]|uniref:class I SAM-dependent methyltransferase n=1 Tax=Leeuwenhoekiella sp. CH_XMU1409-2 TaxID=3107768 RepID=UPI00300B7F02
MTLNKSLLKQEVITYTRAHYKADVSKILLSKSPFEDVSAPELAQQIIGLQKAERKLPSWFQKPEILYPPKLNLEQTSSEETARYKASLFSGSSAIDLTGGLGIDTYFLSTVFDEVIHCEMNAELSELAQHNFEVLGAKNIKTINQNSIDFIKNTVGNFDLIYCDPSRRNEVKGKVFMLKDCEPNIPEHLDFLLDQAMFLVIKTSPLLDIAAGLRELKNVIQIHCVAVKNEVKELLWVLSNETQPDIELIAVNLTSAFDLPVSIEGFDLQTAEATYDSPSNYLYEPNAALLKLGCFNWISSHYKLDKLAPNTHLYTSTERIEFPGRCFKINAVHPYSKKNIAKFLKGKKANITTRNFKESVASLRAKFKVKSGGDLYLFFTTLEDSTTVMLECEKI